LFADKFSKDQSPFSLLFIDIDYFKKVNDSYGHIIGTKLLEDVAFDIRKLLRDADITYRYGGDEFVIILVDSNAEAGKKVGERILKQIKSKTYDFQQKEELIQLHLSVSIGVAEFPGDATSSDEVLALADRMMYEAKESGRGLVFNTKDIFKSSLKKIVKG
jgi:diguanylate cyclase (GGDEF)-like protein